MIKKISFKVNVDDTNATIQKVTVNGQGDDDVNGFTKRLFNRFWITNKPLSYQMSFCTSCTRKWVKVGCQKTCFKREEEKT